MSETHIQALANAQAQEVHLPPLLGRNPSPLPWSIFHNDGSPYWYLKDAKGKSVAVFDSTNVHDIHFVLALVNKPFQED